MTEPELRVIRIEARRIARELVKNEIRKRGSRPSFYSTTEISDYAEELIAKDHSITEQAIKNLKTTRTSDHVRKLVIPERKPK